MKKWVRDKCRRVCHVSLLQTTSQSWRHFSVWCCLRAFYIKNINTVHLQNLLYFNNRRCNLGNFEYIDLVADFQEDLRKEVSGGEEDFSVLKLFRIQKPKSKKIYVNTGSDQRIGTNFIFENMAASSKKWLTKSKLLSRSYFFDQYLKMYMRRSCEIFDWIRMWKERFVFFCFWEPITLS